jgi:hypothetical protein
MATPPPIAAERRNGERPVVVRVSSVLLHFDNDWNRKSMAGHKKLDDNGLAIQDFLRR